MIWAEHAWRKIGSIVRTTIEENPTGKRPWKDRDYVGMEGEKFVWQCDREFKK